jgi:hypothetical protein
VFHAAEDSGRNPYVTYVGREGEPCCMRRVRVAYDASYPGEPLPILTVDFRPVSGTSGATMDRVIADTAADASAATAEVSQPLTLRERQRDVNGYSGVCAIWAIYPCAIPTRRGRLMLNVPMLTSTGTCTYWTSNR